MSMRFCYILRFFVQCKISEKKISRRSRLDWGTVPSTCHTFGKGWSLTNTSRGEILLKQEERSGPIKIFGTRPRRYGGSSSKSSSPGYCKEIGSGCRPPSIRDPSHRYRFHAERNPLQYQKKNVSANGPDKRKS